MQVSRIVTVDCNWVYPYHLSEIAPLRDNKFEHT